VATDKFLNEWPVTIFMTIITVYALLADDIRLILFEKESDYYFYWMNSFSLGLFLLELSLASLVTADYFIGFYFWLDLVATLSLVTDIAWVWDPIMGTEDVDASNAESAGNVARAGRSARIGTRASRVARIIRLIRLIRVVKLYKNAQAAMLREQLKKEEQLEMVAREEAELLDMQRREREEEQRRLQLLNAELASDQDSSMPSMSEDEGPREEESDMEVGEDDQASELNKKKKKVLDVEDGEKLELDTVENEEDREAGLHDSARSHDSRVPLQKINLTVNPTSGEAPTQANLIEN